MKNKLARWDVVLKRMPPGPIVGVEVGVLMGDMSRELLKARPDLFLYLVDCEGRNSPLIRTEFAAERRKAIWEPSPEAAVHFEDNSLDFVFLDGDHTYECVSKEIPAWLPKVKPGGWLCGHDYDKPNKPQYGVKQAVTEVFSDVETDDDWTWFVRKA